MFIVALLIVLNLLGKMNIGLGVFAHEGSTLLVLFNSLRMLAPMSETVAHTSKNNQKNAYADLMAIQHKRSLY